MANVAILYCKKIQDHSCIACAKCHKAMSEKNGEYGRHDEIELVAMTDCGDCPGLASCSEETCACACTQQLTCDAGYAWSHEACDCLCNTGALDCDERRQPDLDLCACVCRPGCGPPCGDGLICNESLCACVPRGG